jgi:hypothetical protein
MRKMETENRENAEQKQEQTVKLVNLTVGESLFFLFVGLALFLVASVLCLTGKLVENFDKIGVFWVSGLFFLGLCSVKNTIFEAKIKKVSSNAVLIILSTGQVFTCRKIEKLLNQASGNKDPLLLKWGVKKMVRRLENYGYVERNSKIVPGYKITDKGLNLIRIYKF